MVPARPERASPAKRRLLPTQRRRLTLAYWRDTVLLVRQFRRSLVLFLLLLLWSTLWLLLFYPNRSLSIAEATYASLMFVYLNPVLDFPKEPWAQPPFFLVPLIGVGLFAEAVVRFGVLLFSKTLRQEEWQKTMASLYKNHTVVVGLGRIGYRVVHELLNAGKEVVVIAHEQGEHTQLFMQNLRSEGVPVLTGDPRLKEVLESVQIREAEALILASEGDLLNLEVALNARDLNPKLRIVLRLFSDTLAEHAERQLGLGVALSTSAISAPAMVAAALSENIAHAFYIGNQLFHIVEWRVSPENPLVGVQTVADAERKYALSVVSIQHADDSLIIHPPDSQVIQHGDTLLLMGTPEQVARLKGKVK